MARHERIINDSRWWEVMAINNYALLMGYVSMAIKGLGFLVLTWTTVVLLGGFVSMLQKKDFWCLTFITLAQTAGVFDVCLNEKLSYIGNSAWGLVAVSLSAFFKYDEDDAPRVAHGLVFIVIGGLQLLVLVILLCPLAAIYMFGLLFSTGISLWRLIKHDYGSNADGEANLKPALDVLYSLALLQGALFCYRAIATFSGKRIAKFVADKYDLEDQERYLISEYMRKTRIGCEKDPSFATGWNLVTYAVDLMESKSFDDYIFGITILDRVIRAHSFGCQQMAVKHLIGSASSSDHILEKLLRTLDSGGSYMRETRERTARIVAFLASEIHLEQLPHGIQYIASLLDSFEEYREYRASLQDSFERYRAASLWDFPKSLMDMFFLPIFSMPPISDSKYWNDYKELLLQGLRILRELAADKKNRRVMSDTQGLLSKIMAPITSDLLHHIDHVEWSDIVEESLKVMHCLASATGETGAKLRGQISSNNEAVSTMERILTCNECNEELQKQAMGILAQLSMQFTSSSMDTQRTENFIEILLDIFSGPNKLGSSIGKLAGEALAMLSFQGRYNDTIILRVGSLIEILLDVTKYKSYRISAAQILEHLCIHYTKDDACLKKLKESMTDVMPKVLNEVLAGEATQTGNVADKPGFSSPHGDIEGQHDDVPNQLMDLEDQAQRENRRLKEALLTYYVTVCDNFISEDKDLALQFYASGLPRKLKEMVEKNNNPTVACLRMLKVTSKMVISMVKQRGNCLEDLDSLMEALSSASKNMVLLDGSMVFGADDGRTATKPMRTLGSLVKEAKELVATYRAQELENMAPSGSANGEP